MTLEEKFKQLLEFVQDIYYKQGWFSEDAEELLVGIGELQDDE